MSGLYLYFVVEANSKSRSDWKYIKSVIDHFYEPRTVQLKAVCVAGKSNLTSLKKIESETRKARGKVRVIVCADVDNDDDERNRKIINFCRENGFDLVWFNQNIEHVFLNHSSVKDKVVQATKFLEGKDKILDKMGVGILNESSALDIPHSSNLMLILDAYLKRR